MRWKTKIPTIPNYGDERKVEKFACFPKEVGENMDNQYTHADRACKNCKHHQQRWNPTAMINLLFGDDSDHHRCMFNGIADQFDPVTGKHIVVVRTRSCRLCRDGDDGSYCGESGLYWEPSKRFLAKKENLFKVLANTDDKLRDDR